MNIEIGQKNSIWRYLIWDDRLVNSRTGEPKVEIKRFIDKIAAGGYPTRYDYIVYKDYVAYISSLERTTYIYRMTYLKDRQVKLENYRTLKIE